MMALADDKIFDLEHQLEGERALVYELKRERAALLVEIDGLKTQAARLRRLAQFYREGA